MYCPVDCPLTIEFYAFGKTYLVNPSVKLTCSEHIFEKDIEVIAQPGIHSMEVTMNSLTADITISNKTKQNI